MCVFNVQSDKVNFFIMLAIKTYKMYSLPHSQKGKYKNISSEVYSVTLLLVYLSN